jgi:hypothetical protein
MRNLQAESFRRTLVTIDIGGENQPVAEFVKIPGVSEWRLDFHKFSYDASNRLRGWPSLVYRAGPVSAGLVDRCGGGLDNGKAAVH